jgi:hypothetical protein
MIFYALRSEVDMPFLALKFALAAKGRDANSDTRILLHMSPSKLHHIFHTPCTTRTSRHEERSIVVDSTRSPLDTGTPFFRASSEYIDVKQRSGCDYSGACQQCIVIVWR